MINTQFRRPAGHLRLPPTMPMADHRLPDPVPIDTLLLPRWLIPVEPANVVLDDHAVAIESGKIVAVLPRGEALQRYAPRQTRELPDHILIPGLINLHTHAAMALLKGYADDRPLQDWLQRHIWPAETRLVSPDFVRDGTLLACAEMLRGGTTCFNDMYFFPREAAQAALQLGMRAAIGMTVMEFPNAYAHDAEDYLNKGLAVRDELRDEPLLSFTLAPHAPYTVNDATFTRILTLAEQLDVPIHLHVHETHQEISDSMAQYGLRPLERLDRLGLVGPNLIAVHAVHLTPGEIDLLARHGSSVAHCPASNLKLGSGLAPSAALLDAGVNVGIGTDGSASNNRLDMLGEMRLAALLAKGTTGRADCWPAHQALRSATLAGARALGLERALGSIEAGKHADLCALAVTSSDHLPCFDPASHVVHVLGRENVSHVWVGGELCVENGVLRNASDDSLRVIGQVWQNKTQG